MSSLNKAIILGNVGRDPKIQTTRAGGKIANLSIATSERWKDKHSGEQHERTEWHRVVIFAEGLVSIVERYVKKGSRILVEGQLQTRKWTDDSGAEKYTTEIVLKPYRGELVLLGERGGDSGEARREEPRRQPQSSTAPPADDLDDSIPF